MNFRTPINRIPGIHSLDQRDRPRTTRNTPVSTPPVVTRQTQSFGVPNPSNSPRQNNSLNALARYDAATINQHIARRRQPTTNFVTAQPRDNVNRVLNFGETHRTNCISTDSNCTTERSMPEFKKGGTVKKTGVAKLHKGELVIPANMVKDIKKLVHI